jgi:hypothetical protein
MGFKISCLIIHYFCDVIWKGSDIMSKQNGYDEYYSGEDSMYNQTRNNEIADHLEAYVDDVTNLFILDGKSKDEVDKAVKTVRKAVKDLRKGHPEKVFDQERFEEYMLHQGTGR